MGDFLLFFVFSMCFPFFLELYVWGILNGFQRASKDNHVCSILAPFVVGIHSVTVLFCRVLGWILAHVKWQSIHD